MHGFSIPVAALVLAASGMALISGTAAAGTCIAGGCHKEIVSAKFLHGPVAAEEAGAEGCVSCHVPAGAACTPSKAGQYAMKTKEDRLCLLCHERGTGTQHTRSKAGCLSCHAPHGSEESYKMMRASGG